MFANEKILEISTGNSHTLFVSASGKVYACGNYGYGRCGIDPSTKTKVIKPQIIPFLYDIISVASGDVHNLCADKNGGLWVFGYNEQNQLGLGPDYEAKESVNSAVINPYLKGIRIVAAGCHSSLCIDDKGKAFTFGDNTCGECGNGELDTTVSIPYCINDNYDKLKDVIFVNGSCGEQHAVLLSDDQRLCGFGRNDGYEVGNFASKKYQSIPHLSTKSDIGIDESVYITQIFCNRYSTIIVCEQP